MESLLKAHEEAGGFLEPRQSAVRGEGSRSYVFAVRDGKVERRAVTLGRPIGSDVEVMAGVISGDQLVVRGPENLQDGQKVEIRQ